MKRLSFKLISSVFGLLLIGALAGCGDDTSTGASDNSINVNQEDKTGTLQGVVLDATTGARIGGTDLTIKLIQGADHRSPNKLITSETDSLVGEYAFNNVPVDFTSSNIKYKMVITKTGYQRFEGYVSLAASIYLGGSGINITNNSAFNYIRDIYLFPVGATAGDITVYVERDGERVPGATVHLRQRIGSNSLTAEVSSNRLSAAAGLMTSFSATTCTQANVDDTANTTCTATSDIGKAVFAGSTLVLGGAYTPTVLPIKYEDTNLALTTGGMITVGASASPLTQLIAMADEDPGSDADALHYLYASNNDQNDVLASGVLTVVFNRPVALVDESDFTAIVACTGGCNTVVLTDSAGAGSVTAAVSSDGYTLTLTPQFATPLGTDDDSATITFAGGTITLMNDDLDNTYPLFGGVNYIDGVSIVGTFVDISGNL